MSEYIDIYIGTTTKMPEDATEFDYELFERFMSGGPWVAHSEYMRLKDENAKLRELCKTLHRLADESYVPFEDVNPWVDDFAKATCAMRELGIEVE